MALVKKDLSVLFAAEEAEQLKELIIRSAKLETVMAQDDKNFSLSVMLEFSGLVSNLFELYGSSIGHNKSVSWNKLNSSLQKLNEQALKIISNPVNQGKVISGHANSLIHEIQSVREKITISRSTLY